MKAQRTITLAIALASIALGIIGCSGNSTPTKAFQTYVTAMKNKDVKAYKAILSKESLAVIEKDAKVKNKTLDDMIKEYFEDTDSSILGSIQARNETIASDGKTATLEANIPGSERRETIHLTKEDDGWKVNER